MKYKYWKIRGDICTFVNGWDWHIYRVDKNNNWEWYCGGWKKTDIPVFEHAIEIPRKEAFIELL